MEATISGSKIVMDDCITVSFWQLMMLPEILPRLASEPMSE
jgi:hypothetical protein